MPALHAVHARTGTVLAERLTVPRTPVGRGLGLMFRARLPAGRGMWIAPCNGIHMLFMRFAIDAVFLDRQLVVVRVVEGLRPWRVVPLVRGAHGVLELPAGTVTGVGLRAGDAVVLG
jgi:uncharacterized membrane protein (UPF0127 family)